MTRPAERPLTGAKVLVLEDDYFLATDLQDALERAGAEVIGPCADASEAMRLVAAERPTCALLDVNLGHGPSFELPRELTRLHVPFAFVTGYDGKSIPGEFADAERVEKPVASQNVTAVATRMLSQTV